MTNETKSFEQQLKDAQPEMARIRKDAIRHLGRINYRFPDSDPHLKTAFRVFASLHLELEAGALDLAKKALKVLEEIDDKTAS